MAPSPHRRSHACRTPREQRPVAGECAATLTARRSRPAELSVIRRGISDIQARPVDADQSQITVERAARGRAGDRHTRRPKQQFQHLFAEPGTGLGDRHLRRHLPGLLPPGLPGQALDQLAHHLLIGAVSKQRQREHVVDDNASRQQPMALLPPARLINDPVNKLSWEHPRQNTDRDMVCQPRIRGRLTLTGPWHTGTVNRPSDTKFTVWV